MEKHTKLIVWEKAHKQVLNVYKTTEEFPKSELYCLTNQMRRAAISVTANIVEGCKRKIIKDRQHFIIMSHTSLEELKYYFLLAKDLGYINEEKHNLYLENSREIGKMLTGLSRSLIE